MKVKHSLFAFIPLTIAMIALKLGSLFMADSNGQFLGMSGMTVAYTVIGIAIALLIVSWIICICDRKTAQVYRVKKNPIAGILAIAGGIAVAASSFLSVVNNHTESEYFVMSLISAFFAVPAAIALIIMSKVHFLGKTTISGISAIYIFPALWGCAELVTEFLNATKISVSATDMTDLFCYIFITLYFFYHAMIVSRVKGKNPVKSCFVFGLPASAITITYGAYKICYASRAVESLGISTLATGVLYIVIGLYIFSFLFEMGRNTLSKFEVEIIENIPKENSPEEENYTGGIGYNDLVFSDAPKTKKTPDNGLNDYVSNVEGLDDFIIGYDDSKEQEEPIPYFTKEKMEKSADASNMFFSLSDENTNDDLIKAKKTKHKRVLVDENKKIEVPVPAVPEFEIKSPVEDEKNNEPSKPMTEIDQHLSDVDALLKQLDDML